MSKRKNRNKTPNLPQATLDRARQQAGLEPEVEAVEEIADLVEDESLAPVTAAAAAKPAAARAARPQNAQRRKPRMTQAQLERSKQRGQLDAETIEHLLENPTKTVTEEQMRSEYSFVLKDLRNMFVLAAILIVIMFILVNVF